MHGWKWSLGKVVTMITIEKSTMQVQKLIFPEIARVNSTNQKNDQIQKHESEPWLQSNKLKNFEFIGRLLEPFHSKHEFLLCCKIQMSFLSVNVCIQRNSCRLTIIFVGFINGIHFFTRHALDCDPLSWKGVCYPVTPWTKMLNGLWYKCGSIYMLGSLAKKNSQDSC